MARIRRSRRVGSLAKAAELSLIAPQVIALRALRMNDRGEMHRMGAEKVLAFWESMNAMSLAGMDFWWRAWLNPWSMGASATKILEKGLEPVHRRASANARRLSRVRRRR